MKLTRYGTDNIIMMLTSGSVIILMGITLFELVYGIPISLLGATLCVFAFIFFRDPDRKIPVEAVTDESLVLSPADGRVIEVADCDEMQFLKTKAIRISIFLSPLDVHVNRIPATGVIRYFKYIRGKYLAAFRHSASERNEQTHFGIETSCGKVYFKQIVGVLARRLVWKVKIGDSVRAGSRFGMMKFGSRMDVFVPFGSEIIAATGNKVTAGVTVIARLIRS